MHFTNFALLLLLFSILLVSTQVRKASTAALTLTIQKNISIMKINKMTVATGDTLAEWLRRSTRNRLGLSRVGSSPASVGFYF